MEAEKLLNLFEFFWFEREIFSMEKKTSLISEIAEPETPKKSPILNHKRSMSEQISSTISFESEFSPPRKLETIPSGVEIPGFESPELIGAVRFTEPPRKNRAERRRRRNHESKSMSELEFEEVKGFMDLGFVFSEKDRDSSLASIIPGLQRLGNHEHDTKHEAEERKHSEAEEEEDDFNFDESATVSRPYLSEAWEILDLKPKKEPLMKWRFPPLSNEIDMKDSLRWWAHTVASTVR